MKNCTFKPCINGDLPESFNKVVVVRGLERHLEIKEMQIKKEMD